MLKGLISYGFHTNIILVSWINQIAPKLWLDLVFTYSVRTTYELVINKPSLATPQEALK